MDGSLSHDGTPRFASHVMTHTENSTPVAAAPNSQGCWNSAPSNAAGITNKV